MSREIVPPDDDPGSRSTLQALRQHRHELMEDPTIARCYQNLLHPDRYRRRKFYAWGTSIVGIFGIIVGGALEISTYSAQEQQDRQHRLANEGQAINYVLKDSRYLGGLGLCNVELQAQAKMLRTQPQADRHSPFVSAEAYDRAAALAQANQVPCKAAANSHLNLMIEDGSIVEVNPPLVTKFDAPYACTLKMQAEQINDPSATSREAAAFRGAIQQFVKELHLSC
jgi:hypothetical protein